MRTAWLKPLHSTVKPAWSQQAPIFWIFTNTKRNTKCYSNTQEASYLYCVMFLIVPWWSGWNLMRVYYVSDQKCHTLSASFIAMHLISTSGRLSVRQSFILRMPLCVYSSQWRRGRYPYINGLELCYFWLQIEPVIIRLHLREAPCHLAEVTCVVRFEGQ